MPVAVRIKTVKPGCSIFAVIHALREAGFDLTMRRRPFYHSYTKVWVKP